MHAKAENCRQIDVRRWQREGVLQAGSNGAWQWSDAATGAHRASISYRTEGRQVILRYLIDGERRDQTVRLSASACNYGGGRPWFICPVRGERVAVLYLRAGRFACRHCQRLKYASQSDDDCARTWRAQAKAERLLEADWRRPKGMHGATHERLLARIFGCIERRERALSLSLESLMRRYPMLTKR
jgi:hypothetical protein